ncbi:hypothetical protein BD289DRAFT_377903 [Coniella lustricola]|uniref:BZIP domain-containing protein n=1 Tax=Coniella lustricola TaxID=2025994 RepID=A0A2T2ZUU1_9PEZI|nr:hypothetical protein BD289DRAFT_377903 [Coniella lustricola]
MTPSTSSLVTTVEVLSMHPLLQHATKPDDDWTGLRDRAERKKRQTRLNVRAHRRRKAAEQQQQTRHASNLTQHTSHSRPPLCLASVFTGPIHALPLPALGQPYHNLSRQLFPLSSDHLIPLIEYNVYRATLTNIYILSLFQLLQNPDCAYLLNPQPPLFPTESATSTANKEIPASLHLTELQRTTPHELWIDTIPSPRMRDNAIRAVQQGRLNEDQVCGDVLRGLCGGAKEEVDARLIVWTMPWDASGWEVTEGFARKYAFLLEGCEDMLMATNRYRRQRGDDALVWKI